MNENGHSGGPRGREEVPGVPGLEMGPPPRRGRVLLMLLGLAAALAIVYATPLRSALTEIQRLTAWLEGLGWAAPAVFVAGVAVLVAMGCPRLLFCSIAGMAFGFSFGLVWVQAGTLLGSYATFLFVRWGGQEFVLRRWPRLRRYSRMVADRGTVSVLLVRQIPASGFLLNTLLGLTHVGHRPFLLGTLIGTLPEAIPATLLGAGVAQLSLGRALAYVLAAAVWFLIVWHVFRWYRRSSASGRGTETAEHFAGAAHEPGK